MFRGTGYMGSPDDRGENFLATQLWQHKLQILLTIAVSIATCERSFSNLKLILTSILNYFNSNLPESIYGQNRFSDLALLMQH